MRRPKVVRESFAFTADALRHIAARQSNTCQVGAEAYYNMTLQGSTERYRSATHVFAQIQRAEQSSQQNSPHSSQQEPESDESSRSQVEPEPEQHSQQEPGQNSPQGHAGTRTEDPGNGQVEPELRPLQCCCYICTGRHAERHSRFWYP